jgi:hypothetical protein
MMKTNTMPAKVQVVPAAGVRVFGEILPIAIIGIAIAP